MLPESASENARRALLVDEAGKWLAKQLNHVLEAKARINEIYKTRKKEKTGEDV